MLKADHSRILRKLFNHTLKLLFKGEKKNCKYANTPQTNDSRNIYNILKNSKPIKNDLPVLSVQVSASMLLLSTQKAHNVNIFVSLDKILASIFLFGNLKPDDSEIFIQKILQRFVS